MSIEFNPEHLRNHLENIRYEQHEGIEVPRGHSIRDKEMAMQMVGYLVRRSVINEAEAILKDITGSRPNPAELLEYIERYGDARIIPSDLTRKCGYSIGLNNELRSFSQADKPPDVTPSPNETEDFPRIEEAKNEILLTDSKVLPAPDLKKVLELHKQLGSLDAIDNNTLLSFGYRRITSDYIVPINFDYTGEYVESSTNYIMGEWDINAKRAIEKKNATKPFEPFTIKVKTYNEIDVLIRQESRVVEERVRKAAEHVEWLPVFEKNSPGEHFQKLIEESIKKRGVELYSDDRDKNEEAEMYRNFQLYVLDKLNTAFNTEILPQEVSCREYESAIIDALWSNDFDLNQNITLKQATGFWTKIDKLRAKIEDELSLPENSYLFQFFDEYTREGLFAGLKQYCTDIDLSTIPENAGIPKLTNESVVQYKKRVVNTILGDSNEIIKYGMQIILEDQGLTESAQMLHGAKSHKELLDIAIKLSKRSPDLKDTQNKIKQLKVSLKDTDDAAVIHNINQELSSLKKDVRNNKITFVGMAEILEAHYGQLRKINTTLKQLQDSVLRRKKNKGENPEEIELRLESGIDKTYDANPGAIVGDCTEDRPLPFLHPDVPVYNVKVASKEDNKVLGFIYLLVAKGIRLKPTWHLEAIQIPSPVIVWDDFRSQVIVALADIAQKAGIEQITINQDPMHISNFDYIRDAFSKELSQRKTTRIHYPSIPDEDYSSFQGINDRAIVLWEDQNTINEEK